MKRLLIAAASALLFPLAADLAASPPESGWQSVDEVFGIPGKDQPGDVHRYGWPRTDLHVRIAGVPVEPALGLGGWAAFKKMGNGQDAVTMGDLVLLGPEVNPVARELQAGGFEILAIHNHLIDEIPRVLYLHFYGKGEATALAKTLKSALQKTKTPLAPPAGKAPPKPTLAQEAVFQKIQDVLGRKGTHRVRLWAYEPQVCESVAQRRLNELFLPDYGIPQAVAVTNDMARAFQMADRTP